jgi:integrase
MKTSFPRYHKSGVAFIEKKLSSQEKEVLEMFGKVNRRTCGEERVIKHRRVILQVRDIMQKSILEITKNDVIEFLGLLNHSDRTEWTKNDIKKSLKKFLKWHYKDLELIEDIKGVSKSRAFNHKKINEKTLIQPYEMEAMLRTADSLKWKAVLIIIFESGCRPQELRKLKWEDIKFDDISKMIDVTFFSDKTKQSRTVPLKEGYVHLKRWYNEFQFEEVTKDDYVFPSQRERDKPMNKGTINEMFKRISKKAGIRKIFPYLARHTRLTELWKKLPEQVVKKFGGHSPDSDMTAIYSHLNSEDVKSAMLEKIYHVEELTTEQKDRIKMLEDKINAMEEQRAKELKVIYEHLHIN